MNTVRKHIESIRRYLVEIEARGDVAELGEVEAAVWDVILDHEAQRRSAATGRPVPDSGLISQGLARHLATGAWRMDSP